jgi:hypothetical protein
MSASPSGPGSAFPRGPGSPVASGPCPAGPAGGNRRRCWPAAGFLAVALTVAAVAGCAIPGAGRPVTPARLFGTGVTQAQQQTIWAAEQQLVQRCMRRQGLPYDRVPWASGPPSPAPADPLYVSVAALRSQGYGLYQTYRRVPKTRPAVDPNAALTRSLPQVRARRWAAALQGNLRAVITLPDGRRLTYSDAGGCNGRAQDILYGSAVRYTALELYSSDIFNLVRAEAQWSGPWTSAQTAWSRCMARHGYGYLNEAAARGQISQRYAAPAARRGHVHRYELAVAAQDAACTTAVRLNPAGFTAISRTVAGLTSSQVAADLAWDQLQVRGLRVARSLLVRGDM